MSMHLAALSITNATVLCVGGITKIEAENAKADGKLVDGSGYYLYLANEGEPDQPIQVLAKFFSPIEAEACASALGIKGAELL